MEGKVYQNSKFHEPWSRVTYLMDFTYVSHILNEFLVHKLRMYFSFTILFDQRVRYLGRSNRGLYQPGELNYHDIRYGCENRR